ncbi:MAG TPA: DNA cytosine methyltransferase [Terriglobales bacterium]|jgi:DNA (cytosine-5)-methyltransferase 1|nr:DNA cytosine methyltransferase [Terriglobales bacterium]
MPISDRLRSVDLFVGAGGLALGTALAGFHASAVLDSDHQSCETLRYNKQKKVAHVRDWEILESDVRKVDFSKYADVDLLSGGPPCQPFSQGGKHHGRSDSRDMFPEFIRAVRDCQPRAFLIENVKGMLHRSFVNYFNYVIYQLRFPQVLRRKSEKWTEHRARLERLYTGGKVEDTQYRVIWQILNAANYGVAQSRERVFVVGVRADLGIEYSFPIPTHSRDGLLFDQWVSGSYWERHGVPRTRRQSIPVAAARVSELSRQVHRLAPWRTVRDAVGDLPNVGPGRRSHIVLNHFFNPGARTYKGHEGSRLDAPAKTIKAGYHGVSGGENVVCLDDGSARYFSVRECARLQSFPDDWAFEGSWCNSMRQIGNAVPVTLSQLVAAPLATALSKKMTDLRRPLQC